MAINIGAPAVNRATAAGHQFTWVVLDTPAPFDGTIITVELWAHIALTATKVGSFIRDGDKFTSRDWTLIGDIPAGSKQTFEDLDIDVVAGDCIGIKHASGSLDIDTAGRARAAYRTGDAFDAGEKTYTILADYMLSLGGWVQLGPGAPAKRSYGYVIG